MTFKNFTFLIFPILLSSCGIYRPNVINVPLIQQKKMLQLGGHASFTGIEAQGSYSINNKIAIMGNFNYRPTKTKTYSHNNFTTYKHHFAEVGIGYYRNLPRNRVFEIFILAGQGSTYTFDSFLKRGDWATEIFKGKYNRFLLQTDFGWIKNKWRLAISSRIFMLEYFDVVDTAKDYSGIIFTKNQLYAEGAFTLHFRISKHFDISSQLGMYVPLIDDLVNFDLERNSGLNTSLGLWYNFDFSKKSGE